MRDRNIVQSFVLFLLVPYLSLAQDQQGSTKSQSAPPNQTTITVTVTDRDHHPVTGLRAADFTLHEDGLPQAITSVASGDVPGCIGFLIDKSGSMRGRHAAIAAGLGELVRAGNPGSKYFVVLFSDGAWLQQDFTGDAVLIEQVISATNARGGTAFYDSLIVSADHLAQARSCQKRALVLVSDGVDNESRRTLENTLKALKDEGNPLVYAIGVPERMANLSARGKRALQALAASSGGEAILIKDYGDLGKAARRLAEELRGQYSLTYTHGKTGTPQVEVRAHTDSGKNLTVRINVAPPPGEQDK